MTRHAGKPAVAAMEMSDDIPPDGLVATGRTLQRVQTSYTTAIAVQKPREIKKVQEAILNEASLAGEGFFYSMKFKDKKSPTGFSVIEGPSIDGAMIMARNWGNCVSDVWQEEDAPMHWLLGAAFIDLETGFTEKRLFRQRKSESHMRGDNDRKLDIAFQIGQSKAKRNVIIKTMPEWLKDAAMAKAREGAARKYTDLKTFVPRAIDGFARIGVPKEKLEKRIGISADKWTANDLVTLATIMRAIKDGQTSIDDEFADEAPPPVEQEPRQADASKAAADGAGGDTAPPAKEETAFDERPNFE